MFSGSIPALVTPFGADGGFAEDAFRALVDWQIAEGSAGLVPCGTTGEAATLTFDEHFNVVRVCVEQAAGRVPILAGAGSNDTRVAIANVHAAKAAGADAALMVPPYYNRPSQEGIFRHFEAIAAETPLPIVLYNIPGRTGITMSPQTVARLNEHPNIVAIKEATGSLDMASEIQTLCDITILSGDDSLTLPLMSIGGKGIISVISNLLPDRIKLMSKLALSGKFADAAVIHTKLFPLIKSLFLDGNPVGIKYAMKVAGRDTGELRLPLVEASEAV